FAAYPSPAPAPPPPTWTKAYEHPTARRVVSTGIQLAVDANREIRRASIYVGLLALGAFGPAVLLLLLGLARLLGDPSIAATIADDPTQVFIDQPDLLGPLALIYFLLIVGVILLVAISIDAQAMAITILGGRAAERPIRLWEAIVRARQVFWRLFAAGLMVGVVSIVVQLVITIPFIRPFDSNTGLSFIASMIGAIVVTPFAFASTGIVLGDVPAVEALRRSMALFRARPRISLVVTLFTLVTSAIQTFAISAGADAAVRVGEVLHLGLDQGPLPLVITVIIVLAFIVAFGSLTFTIAAMVAAPQVTGFLGLTYYSGGIDKARSLDGARPRRFRWVSVPMAVTMLGVLLLAGIGLPSVASFQPRPPDPIVSMLRTAAGDRDVVVVQYGATTHVEDPTLDVIGAQRDSIDIVGAGYAYLPEVPAWLLSTLFDCDQANVACGDRTGGQVAFADGAYLFHQRMSAPPGVASGEEAGEWGPLVVLSGYYTRQPEEGNPVGGASHAFVTRMVEGSSSMHLFVFQPTFTDDVHTNARSTWIGSDLLTIVPVGDEIDGEPVRWDAFGSIIYSRQNGHDLLRATTKSALLIAEFAPEIDFAPGFGP
ncbi:MAG: hypothetical protein ABI620_08190, partial [Chloroflexota bacterium]